MASGPQAEGMAQEGAMSCPEAHWLDYGVGVCSAQELSVKINQGPLVVFLKPLSWGARLHQGA